MVMGYKGYTHKARHESSTVSLQELWPFLQGVLIAFAILAFLILLGCSWFLPEVVQVEVNHSGRLDIPQMEQVRQITPNHPPETPPKIIYPLALGDEVMSASNPAEYLVSHRLFNSGAEVNVYVEFKGTPSVEYTAGGRTGMVQNWDWFVPTPIPGIRIEEDHLDPNGIPRMIYDAETGGFQTEWPQQ